MGKVSLGDEGWACRCAPAGSVGGQRARKDKRAKWSRLRLQAVEVLPFAVEHRPTIDAQPGVQQRGVDAAEIGVILQVAGIQALEAGMVADDAALDRRAG